MFDIQDPRYENGVLLNETLLEACEKALYGAGTYAFVSADGIDLLMRNQTFERFISQGQYSLIIGMDEITNSKTLSAIQYFCDLYPNLRVDAFMHHTIGSTFHPKYSWFRYENGGTLVLGSGNLTLKGLRRNTEAFVVQHANKEEIVDIEKKWLDWVESSKAYIKPLEDPAVIRRAEENRKKLIKNGIGRHLSKTITYYSESRKIGTRQGGLETEDNAYIIDCDDEYGAWEFDINSEVLIAELSAGYNSKGKWSYQADFDREVGTVFFCANSYPKKTIVLRKVTDRGFIEGIETHSIILTPSNKYQLQIMHPERGGITGKRRLLTIFVKLSVRTFLYTIIMPEHREYKEIQEELNNYRSDINHLVRLQINATALKNKFPSLDILEYLDEKK